jgi:hypothetical protein
MPTTLAEMIKVADSYALGDPMQPAIAVDPLPRYPPRQDFWNNNSHHKRREDFPDRRYSMQQVAAVQDNPEAGGSQRQKTGGQPWGGLKKQWGEKKPWHDQPKYTMESAMNQPCRFHTPHPSKPANHTTRNCSWTQRLMKEGLGGLPPPPPLTGANAQPVQAPANWPQ